MKLFASIYQGTLRGNSHGLLVFTNLLAHCDVSGEVDIHPRSVAEEVGLTVEQVRSALDILESADDESRSPEEQGRRIVRLDEHRAWGWRVVNYGKYRAIRNEDDRREQNRLSQARWRDKQASASGKPRKPRKPPSAQAEADGEGDSVAKATVSAVPTRTLIPCPYRAIVDAYHEALPNLPRVKLFDGKTWNARCKAMREMWGWVLSSRRGDGSSRAQTGDEALAWIGEYFKRAAENDFIAGRTPRSEKHGNWKADIDYLMTTSGMKQVIEKTEGAA